MAGAERKIEGAITVDTTVPDSALTREQIIARNLEVVEAHFHNENPEHVEKAIALYGDRVIPLRRFATEQFVFDDQIGHVTIVGDEMLNIPYPIGSELAVRLTHLFEMKDGKKVVSSKKFFPGYILVNMAMSADAWHMVKNTHKVTGFVGSGTRPMRACARASASG